MSIVFIDNPTERGFNKLAFIDRYGAKCSIQESSLATEDCIWLGIEDANPQILASEAKLYGIKTEETCGWIPYPIPEDVLLSTRMHLTQEQVKALIPILTYFVKTGEVRQKGDQ